MGRTVTLNGFRYTVIGVTPAEFSGGARGVGCNVYVPSRHAGA